MYLASKQADVAAMQELLREGSPVDYQNEHGESSVYACAEFQIEGHGAQHVQALELLVSAGANLDLCDSLGTSPLMIAAWYGHHSIVKILLDAGADVTTTNQEGRDAAYFAAPKDGATMGHTECRKLIESARDDLQRSSIERKRAGSQAIRSASDESTSRR